VFPTHLAPQRPGREQPSLLETRLDQGLLQLLEGQVQPKTAVFYPQPQVFSRERGRLRKCLFYLPLPIRLQTSECPAAASGFKLAFVASEVGFARRGPHLPACWRAVRDHYDRGETEHCLAASNHWETAGLLAEAGKSSGSE